MILVGIVVDVTLIGIMVADDGSLVTPVVGTIVVVGNVTGVAWR